jgi:hypothetical protein
MIVPPAEPGLWKKEQALGDVACSFFAKKVYALIRFSAFFRPQVYHCKCNLSENHTLSLKDVWEHECMRCHAWKGMRGGNYFQACLITKPSPNISGTTSALRNLFQLVCHMIQPIFNPVVLLY